MTSSDGQWVWRKSSFSQGNTNSDCVEVAWASPVMAVRDSKNPDGGMLVIPESSWRALVMPARAAAGGHQQVSRSDR